MERKLRSHSGYFITLEGPEGCGKTSHIPYLVEYLRETGLKVFPTREPGGTSIGEQIREVIHDLKNTEMHRRTETLLYQSARAQIVEQVLKPRLNDGEVIVSDRYIDSTIAYQGYGREQDINKVKGLVEYATDGLKPDLTIYVDVDTEEGLRRKDKQQEWNRMDNQTLDFHQRVHHGYEEIIAEEVKSAENRTPRFVVIDGNQKREVVFTNLKIAIETRLLKDGLLKYPCEQN